MSCVRAANLESILCKTVFLFLSDCWPCEFAHSDMVTGIGREKQGLNV